jgi:hypothetical protein
MKRYWLSIGVAIVAVLGALSLGAVTPEPAQAQLCQILNNCPPPPPPPPPQCRDGADNDGDGRIDFGTASTNDPGCAGRDDNSEISQCADGIDNDGDGKRDFGSASTNDHGCAGLWDDDETDPPPPAPACADGVDNDGDTKTDTADPGCSTATDNDETSACADTLDNDFDGKIDFGPGASNDRGCSSLADHDETDPPLPTPQCSDSVDNDADGKEDAEDPGCTGPEDDDETSACADGFDNDGDGKKDFGSGAGNDGGCSSLADDDETDPPPPPRACADGVDNDYDGKIDFGSAAAHDPGCDSAQDDDETSQCADGADNDGDGEVDFGPGNDAGCASLADDDETNPPAQPAACSDGVDNDYDGKKDFGSAAGNDPGCSSAQDDDETSACANGQDDDGDGLVDFGAGRDPGCASKADNSEADITLPPSACSDGVDNDADAKTDAGDPGCSSSADDDETSQCADGQDNDGDAKKDFGASGDPGCSAKSDDDETDPPAGTAQCADGVDNDTDGAIDFGAGKDPGCSSATDDDETSQCADGFDNDGDGRRDFGAAAHNDPGCSSKADNDETDPAPVTPQCSDGVDNDFDSQTDGQDPGCASPTDPDETSACANGLDDDGDGKVDFGPGKDPGCSSTADHDEADVALPPPACSDGVDNDSDTKKDFGANGDPGCSSAQDNDETSQCADSFDNDGDARTDFGAGGQNDPGCASKADNDETDAPPVTPQCSDGVDNDADGRVDAGADPGCDSAQDDAETSQCADGQDNDGDGKVDFGAADDPGCAGTWDDDETDPPAPQPACGDGVDNDADRRTDLEDPGCASATDDDETSRCANGADDDGDLKIDFGQGNDPGCSSKADNDETDVPLPDPACSDGVDNDVDGKTDFGLTAQNDPGCADAQDDDETDPAPPASSPPNDQEPPADEDPPGGGGDRPPPEQTSHPDQRVPDSSEPVADEAGAAPLVTVARRIAPPWAQFQLESGLFRNPLTGVESPGGYGPVMIGHGLLREGRRGGDAALISSGIRAITATVSRSSGVEENPLQLLAVASAYNWARRNLAGVAAFDADRAAWERYLATWKTPGVGPGAQGCFQSPTCFHSYDLIDAVATLELFASGVQPALPDARLADTGARARAIAVLGQGAYSAIGRAARTLGAQGRLYRLGILSDNPANPLAYHALSIAALARGISLLGAEAPAEARIALKRAIDATSSFVGPDGDVAYIGRAHGAVWALGATVYAAHVCARSFTEFAHSTGRRCDTLAGRTLDRIVRDHDFGNVGLNAIPRFRTSNLDDRGLDPYANLISSAGLTAVFLEWAADERRAREVPPEAAVPLPLEGGGTFVDPVAARFAVLRSGPTWFAVHAEPTSLRDPRYDFGLVSLKARGADRRWTDVLPPRPLPLPGAGDASSGPVLTRGRSVGYPAGTRMSVDRRNGTITIHGGWRTRRGRWLRRGVAFRYRAIRGGVRLTFRAEDGDRITVADFVSATAGNAIAGTAIDTPSFSSTLSPPGRRIARTPGWSSAYDASLIRVTRTLRATRDGTITWTIAAR